MTTIKLPNDWISKAERISGCCFKRVMYRFPAAAAGASFFDPVDRSGNTRYRSVDSNIIWERDREENRQ